ncbi:hypothetical protein SFOMI_4487 [Sphingobium fuliginis]|jgi:hypothetical protein|uniref:Uncharacterized protein n=1 Tax=Sphingobium fuliginis (strain ATCC 27551) TaxID=336203 RepID=A0A292ZM05_SPHSA|nr:hypothetical protein TZ53_08265 [Sphingobium sp. YBL2]PNP99805.1 hypothetical protein A8G00_18495 [Sphingobium sp. SA916]GAY23909.1 hypothetical protein SFOMI_4487 [Sphingobium fuliginis]
MDHIGSNSAKDDLLALNPALRTRDLKDAAKSRRICGFPDLSTSFAQAATGFCALNRDQYRQSRPF